MVNISIHSLYWNNTTDIADLHKEVTAHLKIPVNYHNIDGIPHGYFCNEIMKIDTSDIIGFMDIDCVPTNIDIVNACIQYANINDSFVGVAQCSNHILPATHIYVAPSFFFIKKTCYEYLNKPSFIENYRSDVGEELSYIADEKRKTYCALYPICYDKPANEGKWRLNNYGYFGIGTYYSGGIYNLFQSRLKENRELFATRCKQIIDNNFDYSNMINSVEI